MGRPKEHTDEQILQVARRCFRERGAGVPAAEIARELGVSHTTLFHRFGSKEGLMLAALGPPAEVGWIGALEAGPDERPLRTQLVEHATVMAGFFDEVQQGYAVLLAAGIDPARSLPVSDGVPAPERAFAALVGWLARAQRQGRLAPCDLETLASTLLGALHGWAVTARVCGRPGAGGADDGYVERFIGLLWDGVGPRAP